MELEAALEAVRNQGCILYLDTTYAGNTFESAPLQQVRRCGACAGVAARCVRRVAGLAQLRCEHRRPLAT